MACSNTRDSTDLLNGRCVRGTGHRVEGGDGVGREMRVTILAGCVPCSAGGEPVLYGARSGSCGHPTVRGEGRLARVREGRAGEAAAETGVVGGGGDARHEAVEQTLEDCDRRNTGCARVRISTGVTGTTADPLPPVEHDSWAEGIDLGSDSAYGIAVISSATGPSGGEPMAARSGTRKSTDLINTGR